MPWERPVIATAGFIKIGGLGEERKGAKGPWRAPIKLNHFIITKTVRGDDTNLIRDTERMQALKEAGWADPDGQLRELPIQLHSDNLDEVFPTNLAYYAGKSLLCRGDGHDAQRYSTDKEGNRTGPITVGCPCEHSVLVNPKGKCKPNGSLHCSLRLPGLGSIGSLFRWRTTSQISISRMMGSLLQVQEMVGSLKAVPLVLVLEEVELAGKAPVYCCHLELRENSLIDLQKHLLAMTAQRNRVALTSSSAPVRLKVIQPGDHEDDAEQAAIADEFYSDHADDAPAQSDGAGQDDLT